MLRLKRTFGKAQKGAQLNLRLAATPENARDLEWFIDRYPLEPTNRAAADQLALLSARHRESQALIDDLLNKRVAPAGFAGLAIPAREYQELAAAIILSKGSLLVADDVGLGKTLTALLPLCDPRTLPAVVVTLTHLPRQWAAEVAKFLPHLTTHIIRKSEPYDITAWGKRRKPGQMGLGTLPDVLIINYHKLAGWGGTLAQLAKYVVFDEVQELRTGSASQKYRAAKAVAEACEFRSALSATPIYNYGFEIYNVMGCVTPGALGDPSEFQTEWCGWKGAVTNPTALGAYLRDSGLMIRRTRKDVNRELPPLSIIRHEIDADPDALNAVSDSCAELARTILAQGPQAFKGEKMLASEEFNNKLRQATGIAKAPYVADFVRLMIEADEPVVLYGWHRECYSIWLDKLKDLAPVMFTGSETPNQKDEAKRKFLAGESNLMIISLRAGAGMDGLQQRCRTVVFGELDWSPGVHEQCIGRVNRDGQVEPVAAYYLVSDYGSDPTVADVLGIKANQIDGIRDQKTDLIEALQNDGGRIKRLAEDFLKARGLALQPAEEDAA